MNEEKLDLRAVLDLFDRWVEQQRAVGLHSMQFSYVVTGGVKVTVQISTPKEDR